MCGACGTNCGPKKDIILRDYHGAIYIFKKLVYRPDNFDLGKTIQCKISVHLMYIFRR